MAANLPELYKNVVGPVVDKTAEREEMVCTQP